MGWAVLILLALAVAAVLWRVARPGRTGIELVAAALLLGVAGYAWQGSPHLAGRPTPPRANHPPADTLFAAERGAWMDSVGPDADMLNAADNFIRSNDPAYAVGILRGAVARAPNNMMLWLGLANALTVYADGVVTPPARYAYIRAAELSPGNPAAGYFLGLSLAQSGDLDGAERIWRAIQTHSPADAPWQGLIARRLAVLERLRATP